jgi:hypothetical protein
MKGISPFCGTHQVCRDSGRRFKEIPHLREFDPKW